MDKTELENVWNRFRKMNWEHEYGELGLMNKNDFILAVKELQSLPSPSVEEIRERFEMACTWMDGDEEKTIYDHKKVFEFFLPYIKGDAVEFGRFLNERCLSMKNIGHHDIWSYYDESGALIGLKNTKELYTGPYQEYLKTKNNRR